MHLPAALEQWAAEHNEQLSAATLSEVRKIAGTLADSPLGEVGIDDVGADGSAGADLEPRLGELFPMARAERAATLIQVVADWWAKRSGSGAPAPVPAPQVQRDPEPPSAEPDAPSPGPDFVPSPRPLPQHPLPEHQAPRPRADMAADRFATTPAFLRSDKVDEEDDVRLYGPRWPWKPILGTLVVLALLGGAGFGAWYWFTQREEPAEETATTPDTATAAPEADPEVAAPTELPTTLPTATAEPTPEPPSYWADTGPILNSGSAQISASTYSVSPANRAVLTGHAAAITGVVVSDDGRVLTSGADRRLVNWGSDVTLANPDVLNVPAPLTVLERTVDQRVIAGDSDGTVTITDLVNTADPIVLTVHDVAISAAAELSDGRVAIASVDGDVAVFGLETPEERITLPHDVEVTAVVGLDDGRIATAAVDGIVRLWSSDGQDDPDEIATLDAPVTALAVLDDGRLATASVEGAIHVLPATAAVSEIVVLPGHFGAVRALFELTMPDGTLALASGGDDTTIRLWNVDAREQISVLEGHGDIISGLDILPDGRLVSTSGDGTGRVWDLTVPPNATVIPPHDLNLSAVHAWENDLFITGGTDGKVLLASTSDGSEPVLVTEHDAPVVGVSRLQSGDIVSLDANSVLRIAQPDGSADGLVELQLAAGATALDVRPDQGIVTGHADGTVRFHDLTEEILSVEVHGSGVNDVVALTSGLVASAGQDRTVRIIDPEDPSQLPVFDLHTAPVDVVIELPDGRIASAGSDGIYVFTVEGLAQDHIRLNGQRSRTISLVALPDDRLLSTGDDGRIRLWDLTSPESEPTTLIDIPGIVNPHLIQADNGLFVAGAARGYVVFTPS